MKHWQQSILFILFGIIISGVIFLVTSPPRGEPLSLLPPPSPLPIMVHISGAVINPGVYSLAPNSRVSDAVQAASGLSPDADQQSINLAKFVIDGEKIYIGTISSPKRTDHQSKQNNAVLYEDSDSLHMLININTANQNELEKLPEIGSVIAGNIIKYRQEHGYFDQIEDIQKVDGIGPSLFAKIEENITVGDNP